MRVRGLIGRLGWTLVVLVSLSAPSPAADPAPEPAAPAELPLRSTQAIQQLLPELAAAHRPVELEAVATFSEPTWRLLFLQDATGGIDCDIGDLREFPKTGDRVRVRGVTDAGAFLPYVILREVENLGPSATAPPQAVTSEELWNGAHDADFVKLTGTVTSVIISPTTPPHARMELVSGNRIVHVTALGFGTSSVNDWIGAQAEVRGVFSPDTDAQRSITRVVLFAASPAQVVLLKDAEENAKTLTPTPLSELSPRALRSRIDPVRLRGSVLLMDHDAAWISDASNSVPMQRLPGIDLRAGEWIDVLALPSTTHLQPPHLTAVRVLERVPAPPLQPMRIADDLGAEGEHHGQYISVEGDLLHHTRTDDEQRWLLNVDGALFEATPAYADTRELAPGSRLRLSGIRTDQNGAPGEAPFVRLRIANAADAVLLNPPPWPMRRTLAAISVPSGLLALGLIALGISYRRQRESIQRAELAEAELREFNLRLERRITDRTAELATANHSLEAEIAERKRAQAELADREARLRHAQSLLRVGSFHWSAPDQLVTWSDELYHIFGRDPGTFQPSFEAYLALIHPEDRENVKTRIHEALRTGRSFTHDYRFLLANGGLRWATAAARVLFDDRGQVVGLEGTCQDVTARKLEEQFRNEQARVLEAIAHGAPLVDVFTALLQAVESQSDGMICSIMLVDEDGKHLRLAAAGSLSQEYCRIFEIVEIGPEVGSCGTAAWRRERVVVEDIESDPLWANFRDLPLAEGLRACWSEPIFDQAGNLLGTFASYYRQPQAPTPQQIALMTSATHTAAIGIQRDRNERSLRATTEALRHRNELLQRMERMAQVGAWAIHVESGELTWSEEIFRIHEVPFGRTPTVAEAIEFYAPEARTTIRVAVETAYQDGTPWDLELPLITAKGRPIWVRAQGQAEFENGKPVRLHGAFQDITQRREAAEELRISEERFQLAMRGANDGLWDWDLASNAAYLSPRWKSMLGYEDHELVNHFDTWIELLDPEQRDHVLTLARQVTAGEVPAFEAEYRMRHRDGRWVDVLSRAFTVRASDGTPRRLVGTHVDISERKRIDSALRALAASSASGPSIEFFRSAAQQLGYLFGMRVAIVAEFIPGYRDRIRSLAACDRGNDLPPFERLLPGTPCEQTLSTGIAFFQSGVAQMFPSDAVLEALGLQSYLGIAIRNRHREPVGALVLMHDHPIERTPNLDPILQLFADRVGAELERNQFLAAVLEAEARFRSAIEHSYEGLSLTDIDGRCTYVSPAVTRISGYERDELIGRRLADLIAPEDVEQFAAHARNLREIPDAHFEAEFRFQRKDGSTGWIQTSVTNRLNDPNLRAVVSNLRDITTQKQAADEQTRLESRLRQAQKMEAIGTLAGGIAHDFNNILGVIIGHAQLARMDVEHLPEVCENLDDTLRAAKRAKDLVKQILTFSRRGEPERHVIALQPLFEESLRLLRAALPATAQLAVRVEDPVPHVLGDATLLQQVILNLATNAAQAIGDQPGRISIVLKGLDVEASLPPPAPGLTPGRYARIAVSDNGPGMDAATLERVFEPFFTTKSAGRGTGLGLAVVHGTVEKHQGTVHARSAPGEGSTFEVYLPAADPAAATTPTEPASSPTPSESVCRGRILVVDDEPSLLRITERVLGLEGYQVTAFADPLEAHQAFLKQPESFDLLITDYLMPGQNGVDLARQITEARPEFPMIICSGHSFGLTRERAAELGFRDFLQKPVEFESLRQAVRAALPSPA